MNSIRRIRRIAGALTGLAAVWLGLAIATPAAFAKPAPPPSGGAAPAQPPAAVHTVVVGMAGWQIALIAAGAALIAAAAAVLLDRARTARRSAVTVAG